MSKGMKPFLIILLLLSLTLGDAKVLAAGHSPFEGINATLFDEKNIKSSNFGIRNNSVGGLRPGDYIVYNNVNFEDAPYKVDMNIAVDATTAGSVELRLDSPTGALIAFIKVKPSNWGSPILNTAFIETQFTGKHNIYLMSTEKTCDIYDFKFSRKVQNKSGYFQYEQNEKFTDINNNKYKNEILTLDELGILTGFSSNSYEPRLPITRGELASYLCRLITEDTKALNVSNVMFNDVPKDYEHYKAINYLYYFGYIKGIDDKNFNPFGLVKLSDAAVVICNILGYKDMAEQLGGYPNGYISIINSVGIDKGLDMGETMRRDNLAKLLYNAISVDFMDVTAVSGDNTRSYKSVKGILSRTKKIYKESALVTANSSTTLYSPVTSLRLGYVKIGEKDFNLGNTKANNFLGVICDYYYKEVNGENVLQAIRPSKNVEQTILNSSTDKIEKIDMHEIVYYEENDKKKIINILPSTSIIYNGKAIEQDINMDGSFRGSVRYIDNGNGNESIFIDEYENVIIESLDIANGIIYDRLKNISIALNDNFVIFKDGEIIEIKGLEQNDTLLIYRSRNQAGKQLQAIFVQTTVVKGEVSETDDEKIVINDKEYKVAIECTKAFYTGLNAEFKINKFNEIVDYSTERYPEKWEIGCILDYQKNSIGGVQDNGEVKLLTDDKVKVFKLAGKVTLDGIVRKNRNEIISGKGTFLGLSALEMKSPVRYMVSDKEEIKFLDTYLVGVEDNNDIIKKITNATITGVYKSVTSMITISGKNLYPINPDSTVITFWNIDDEALYKIGDVKSSLSNDNNLSADLYNLDKTSDLADIIVWKNKSLMSDSLPIVVEKINEALYNNEKSIVVYGYAGSTSVKYLVKPSRTALINGLKGLLKGDYVKFGLDYDNDISEVSVKFLHDGAVRTSTNLSSELSTQTFTIGDSGNQDKRYIFATVLKKDNNYLKVKVGNDISYTIEYLKADSTSVVRCANNGSEFEITNKLNMSSIKEGDKIVVWIESTAIKQIIIYNNL